MNYKYYKLGNEYIAIHQHEDTVYHCSNMLDDVFAKIQVSKRFQEQIETNRAKVEITETEFVNQFSNAVHKLHNDTPFA